MTARDPRREKTLKYLRDTGRPAQVREGPELEEVRRKIRIFHTRGMSYREMARQVGLSESAVCRYANHPDRGMYRSALEKLQDLRFELDNAEAGPGPGARINPVGTVRRLGALWADGFSTLWLARSLDAGQRHVWETMTGQPRYVFRGFAFRVEAVYAALEGVNPRDVGMSASGIGCAITAATRRGVPPRHCWDPDTIDDPLAFPEWTGACGTPRGREIHRRIGVATCTPCAEAFAAYNRERKRRSCE